MIHVSWQSISRAFQAIVGWFREPPPRESHDRLMSELPPDRRNHIEATADALKMTVGETFREVAMAEWQNDLNPAPPPEPDHPTVQPEPEQPAAAPDAPLRFQDPHSPEWLEMERARRRYDKFIKRPKAPKTHREARPRSEPQPEPQPEPEPPRPPPPLLNSEILIGEETATKEVVRIAESEMYGEFNFRDTILDQLDRFFVYLKRMRKRDPDSYAFYKKIGVTLLPLAATNMTGLQFRGEINEDDDARLEPMPKLSEAAPWFNEHRPAFGCFAYGINKHIEARELVVDKGKMVWYVKFLYFTKYAEPPPEVQRAAGGDIYKLTIWWDKPQDQKHKSGGGAPQEYAVFISKDGGEVRVLRMLTTSIVEIQRKHKLEFFNIPKREWKIPKDYFPQNQKRYNEPPEQFLARIFINVVGQYEQSKLSMARVVVRKNKMTAMFGLNLRRVAYFFQDRDVVIDQEGTRKRIFHSVRAHERADGTAVRLHFRGLRQFTWAGYDVEIKIPSLIVDEVGVGAHDEYWVDWSSKRWIGNEEFADRILKVEADIEASTYQHRNDR